MSIQTIKSGVRVHDKSLNFVTGNIRPLKDWVIIKPLPIPFSDTIETNWRGEAVRGKVIAVGPGKYCNIHTRGKKDGKDFRSVRQSKQFRPCDVKIGQTVQLGGIEIQGYLWTHLQIDGEDHIICMEADIALVEED
jgi:co-chaperonin GroES (HSP10)